MKIFYSTSILLLTCFLSISQNIVKSEKFKISFESTEILENYETESAFVLGFDNDNYAVDIEIVTLDQSIKDIRLSARELASGLGFQKIADGGKVSKIDKSFYVKTNGIESNEIYPVYVILILNYSQNIAYEITVDCYNQNANEGLKIVNSFKLLE